MKFFYTTGSLPSIQTVAGVVLGLLFSLFSANQPQQQPEMAWHQPNIRKITLPANFVDDSPVGQDRVSTGWISLFDGHSLFGWRKASDANWRVEGAHIVVDGGEPGLLRTASQFDQFELIVEYACDQETNSGVFVHTSPKPGFDDAMEIEIVGSKLENQTGSIAGRQKVPGQSPKREEFNQLTIRVEGGFINVDLNEKRINRYVIPQQAAGRGYVGLQYSSGMIRFRKILLRPLFSDREEKFTDLSKWKVSADSSFRSSINDEGDLVLTGGPGYVESLKSYGNLVLQMKCSISNGGNSGVFFRCIPGENTNGYESQIDNSGKRSDPTTPSNCGTGGIFRRMDARRIVAEDESWFAITIVAEGPHVAVWVNGYQVTDWTDLRKPDRNPRRGQRTQAGTLMLQGHDDQTTVRFRELRVAELRDRW